MSLGIPKASYIRGHIDVSPRVLASHPKHVSLFFRYLCVYTCGFGCILRIRICVVYGVYVFLHVYGVYIYIYIYVDVRVYVNVGCVYVLVREYMFMGLCMCYGIIVERGGGRRGSVM